jgi:hypothetical protein
MTTLCKTYSDEGEARAAVERLLAAGAPRRGIRLPTGSPLPDVHAERVGTFADSIGRDALVGTFAGRPRWRAKGPAPSLAIPTANATAPSATSSAT